MSDTPKTPLDAKGELEAAEKIITEFETHMAECSDLILNSVNELMKEAKLPDTTREHVTTIADGILGVVVVAVARYVSHATNQEAMMRIAAREMELNYTHRQPTETEPVKKERGFIGQRR